MNFFKAVLFDFDGTIINSKEGVSRCIVDVLEKYNIPVGNIEKLDYFMGPPLHISFSDIYGVEGEECDKLVAAYRERYITKGVYKNDKLYDGIVELIKELRNNGIKVGVASAKPTIFLHEILKYFEIEDLFDTVVGNELDTNSSEKSNLINKALENLGMSDKERCVMVGDRHYDVNGANKVGVKSVGAVYGFGTEKELKDAGADYLVHDTAELLKILLK